jgi:hypothetical protein
MRPLRDELGESLSLPSERRLPRLLGERGDEMFGRRAPGLGLPHLPFGFREAGAESLEQKAEPPFGGKEKGEMALSGKEQGKLSLFPFAQRALLTRRAEEALEAGQARGGMTEEGEGAQRLLIGRLARFEEEAGAAELGGVHLPILAAFS